ncbi:MAG TPA: hypothetical protein VHS28_05855 [Chloroflexota bacterium]|nr:hypothetical protein [Chloroflexota bacterium]
MAVRDASERVTLPVPSKLRGEVREHPESFGLPKEGSEASKLVALLEAGARALREETRHSAQVRLYEQMADDSEYAQSVEDAASRAVEDGLL